MVNTDFRTLHSEYDLSTHNKTPARVVSKNTEQRAMTEGDWPMTTSMHSAPAQPQACACCAAKQVDEPRRRVIQLAVAGLVAPVSTLGSAQTKALGPQAGELLVIEDTEGEPQPLKLNDIAVGKPVLAFPYDAASKTVRDDTRLNKVLLIRFNDADLEGDNRARAAGGVLAFSAICTHQACDVKTWLPNDKSVVCFCHSSKFNVLDGASVMTGPAPRPLPTLPLKLDGTQLVVAGSFSSAPGGQKA
jgi:rieske iron-sulfur protein